MATRADIRIQIRRELRDVDGNTWLDTELNDLINAGINAVSDLSPREAIETATWTAATLGSHFGLQKIVNLTTTFRNIFRVEILTQDGMVWQTLPPDNGEGSSSGWSFWQGDLRLPEKYTLPFQYTAGGYETINVRVYGYADHTLLDSDATETTLTTREQDAVRVFCTAEALSRLMINRATFQQWQVASGATNVSISELAVLANSARYRWSQERGKLRKMRRIA
jgi:hypothetical protein